MIIPVRGRVNGYKVVYVSGCVQPFTADTILSCIFPKDEFNTSPANKATQHPQCKAIRIKQQHTGERIHL